MGALGLLFSTYWKPLAALGLVLLVVGYIGYQRHEINALQRDNASLQQTIELTKAIGQAANEKAVRIEQGAQQAVTLQAQQGQSDINKIKAYYEAHPIIKRVVINSVRDNPTDSGSRQLPDIPATPEESTSSGENNDTATGGSSLEESCAITTVQYNTLHDAWDKACIEFGCK